MFNDDFSSSGGFTGTQRTGLFDDWGYAKSDEARGITSSSNPAAFDVEIVHLGTDKSRLGEAEAAGVKSVPALVIEGHPYHINFGADLSALK